MRIFYTDGSVSDNGTPKAKGGFAWVEVKEDESELISCYAESAETGDPSGEVPTNNRMELLAIISALHCCYAGEEVTIKSDSAYVVNGMNAKWYEGWFKRGRTSTGGQPKNLDLWTILVRASGRLKRAKFVHVKGHRDSKYNILCDELAGEVRKSGGKINGRGE